MLIVALIALALARPFLTLGLPLAAVRAKTGVVIVLDNSYSMQYKDVDGPWSDKAKTLAIDVLKSLRHGDTASLILMSDMPEPVFRQLTPDIENVITSVQQAEVSYRATNVQPSVELAHEMLSESTQQNKELYIISDFAQNGWDNAGVIANRSGARIVLLPVTQGTPHNTNIELIRPSHQLIGVDLPLHLSTKVKNYSDTPIAQTTLTFYVGDEKKKTQTISAAADESIVTTLTHTFSDPGTYTGYFELTDDRLNIDNKRYFALEALGEIRVLCVSEQTEYLTLALNPLENKQNVGAPVSPAMIQPTACTLTEFDTFPLEDIDVVLLADVPDISEKAEVQLQEFVRQGKSIIVFTSDDYNLPWAPAKFGQPITWKVPQQVSIYEETHPIFEIFTDNVLAGQYGPRFFQATTISLMPNANIIARFGDETPFLIEKREGKSHILFFNCRLQQQPNSSELLVNPYFLPLIQHSVLYVMQSGGQKNINVGEPYLASYPQNSWRTGMGKTDRFC